ncbi:hypothetical protein LJK87_36320 [Paenibacillus sp. P25]|nr:hypothetical protein LJK87_36320 [Paenibacillus sp. P25]
MKKKALLLLLTASIGLGVLIWELFDGYERIAVNKVYDNTQTELTASAAALSSAVNRRVAPLQGVASYVENTDSLGPGLDRYLDTLLKDKSGVINVAVYPQGVVQYVYPKEGNENVMGYDVMLDPRPDVQEVITRTIASKKMTINGPLSASRPLGPRRKNSSVPGGTDVQSCRDGAGLAGAAQRIHLQYAG